MFRGGESISNQPILTCKGKNYDVRVVLAYKGEAQQGRGGESVYLKLKGNNKGQQLNSDEQNSMHDAWNLTVFQSGKTKLGDTGITAASGNELWCQTGNVFLVKKQSADYMRGDWEKSIEAVKLTLNRCNQGSGSKTCDIDIENNVGLGWNPSFKPKAIFR